MNDMARAADGPAGVPDVDMRPNMKIRAVVRQVEAIERWVPFGILVLLVGVPVVASLVEGTLINAIIAGVIMFIVAGLVILVVEKLFIAPMRHLRYKRASKKLAQQVQALPKPISQWRYWWVGAPGALGITVDGEIVIVDRSTDYTYLWLDRSHLVDVRVEREASYVTDTKHSGRFTFGGGQSAFGAYTTGGRSRSVTKAVEQAFLEIRYQLAHNGPTYTAVVPFGGDRRGADELCATLVRLARPA